MIETEPEGSAVSTAASALVSTPARETESSAGWDVAVNEAGTTVDRERVETEPMHSGDRVDLPTLYRAMKQALPPGLQAKDITEGAQQLVNTLNAKRKHDTLLIEEFRTAMNSQVQAAVGLLEQHLFQTYETQKSLLEGKLQELFACLDRIAAAEAELVNFRASLSMLYKEMNSVE